MMVGSHVGWKVTYLDPDLVVETHGAPSLPEGITQETLDGVWQDVLSCQPGLYNGRVFCLSGLEPKRLRGFWCEYRQVVAQMRAPELAERLQLRPLAVTGLLECADGIVLGRRNLGSLYLPGSWQGVPAGSVESRSGDNAVDLNQQILAELEEEIGFCKSVNLSGPFLACEHTDTHIVDLGFSIRSSLNFSEVEHLWETSGNDEYDRLMCLQPLDFAMLKSKILPTTRAMMDRLMP